MMSSGFAFFYNISALVGPIIGGFSYYNIQFKLTVTFALVFQALVMIIFAVFNCGPNVYAKDKEHK
jgi:hypothetical protein